MITIDGMEWDVPCNVERTAEVKPSEISGMLLDKNYLNDVIGTYMSYSLTLAVPPSMEYEYSVLYDKLTEPVDGHIFTLPYNEGTVTIAARVDSVRDVLFVNGASRQYWKGVSFTVTANHPTKTMSFEDTILRGLTEVPNITLPSGGGMAYRDVDEEYF